MEYRVNTGNTEAFVGTSLRGYLDAEYHELVERLGEPFSADDFDGKADAVWLIECDDEEQTVATLYNYKDGRTYLGEQGTPTEELRHWHIGGKTQRAVDLVHWLFGRNRQLVVVEVSGGVAEVTAQPEGVDVQVIDHDNESDDD